MTLPTAEPKPRFEMVRVGEVAGLGTVGVSAPEVADTKIHVPVPTIGVFPAMTTDKGAVVPQVVWSGPAWAVVGMGFTVITTSTISPEQLLIHGVTW